MCDAIARGKLRVLIGLLLGVFLIASFEVAPATAGGSGEPVSVAKKKKKKKKCKKGYKRFGKKCYKKRSGSFSGTAGISLFKIIPYIGQPGEFTQATWGVLFEGSTACGSTGQQTLAITGPGTWRDSPNELSYPEPGGYGGSGGSYEVRIEAQFQPKEGWGYPQYLATSATGWFQVIYRAEGQPDCDSGQIAFQVSQH